MAINDQRFFCQKLVDEGRHLLREPLRIVGEHHHGIDKLLPDEARTGLIFPAQYAGSVPFASQSRYLPARQLPRDLPKAGVESLKVRFGETGTAFGDVGIAGAQ